MASNSRPIGIDHGTMNSSIAVMESDGPRPIKPNGLDPVMPSAVYFDKRGRMLVGALARRAMLTNGPGEGNGHTAYKPKIGQNDTYSFPAAKRTMTGPELGAVVIGELLRAYREEMEDDPQVAVVTVPAKFEHSACEGTREAAQKAGLLRSEQLQEPIAAALGYGFTTEDKHAHWMVFDLGGGTLDVSIVIVRKGRMIVPEDGHAGDNRLGGRKFDRELLAYVLGELGKTYSLRKFSETNKDYTAAWGRLTLAVEEAKIELSRREEAVVEVEGALCKDDRGKPVKVEVPINRKLYERLIAPDIDKAVHICQLLLEKNRLGSGDVTRLLLVGGPTKTPFIQQTLVQRLKIEADTSVDPMTVVAQGAAIHATTIEMPTSTPVPVSQDGVVIQLKYQKTSNLPEHFVIGKVEGPAVSEGGVTVEISRTDGGWSSGRLAVSETGVFNTNVLLVDNGKPHESLFKTVVLDSSGKTLASVDEPAIWYPYPGGGDVKPRLANSLRVAETGNLTTVLIKQGADLPARESGAFVTTKPLPKGSREDVLRIPVLEAVTHLFGGEDDHADCNYHVGTLTIKGSDVRVTRDLPQGAEIDVTITQNQSREIQATAYVPLLDEEFEATFQSGSFDVSTEQIVERFEGLKSAIAQAEKLQKEKPLVEVGEKLQKIRQLRVLDEIAKDLDRAKTGENDARYRAYTRLLELAGAVNLIHDLQTTARIQQRIEQLSAVVENDEVRVLDGIRAEYSAASRANDTAELRQLESSLDALDEKVRRRPIADLFVDWAAFPAQVRGTADQVQAFGDAQALCQEIVKTEENGGVVSQSQIERAKQAHERLMSKWPELPEWRQKAIQKLIDEGRSTADLDISDITRAR